MRIKKAIIPVAGFGTRFLPATKAQPKEMLPLVDKPIIQYLVEEAVASGIEEIIFVTGRGKRAIEDHFDHSFELEHNLVEKRKHNLLEQIYKISKLASFAYVRQSEPLGDGHAILCAKKFITNEPCAVLFGDDIVKHKIPCLKQLFKIYEKFSSPVVALEEVPMSEVSKYGVVEVREAKKLTNKEIRKLRIPLAPFKKGGSKVKNSVSSPLCEGGQGDEREKFRRIFEIKDIVEKPKVEEAPSNLTIVGKYIITPKVIDALSKLNKDESGEIKLAHALKILARGKKEKVFGYKFEGVRYDCGSKLGFLKATVDFGLEHPEVGEEFKKFLRNRILDG